MARNLTPEMITALTAEKNRPVLFYEGEFSTGTLRFWTGSGTIVWDGENWEGNGLFLDTRLSAQTKDIEATGIEINLSGVSQAIIQLVLITAELGKKGKIWLGMLNEDGTVIDSPSILFSGNFDTAEIVENEDSPEIAIKYETKLIELERGKEYRYTPESQRIFDPTDKGFDYVAGLQEWDGYWGPKAKPPEKPDKNKNKAKNSNKKKR